MPSLLDAIEAKYGHDGNTCEVPIGNGIGIHVPRINPRKSLPRLLILNACDVDSAGDEESLQKTCAGVIEIDLAHNNLTKWSEISKILQYTPSVTFLNLSFNSLSCPLTATCAENSFRFPLLPRLTVLILIGTNATWDSVWFLLRYANNLQELHMSLNNFSAVDISAGIRGRNIRTLGTSHCIITKLNANNSIISQINETDSVTTSATISSSPPNCNRSDSTDSGNGSSSDDDDGFTFPYIRRVMFDGNPITSWTEVAKLGACFPSLRHVGLADCPIQTIPEDAYQNFENLQSLTISNTLLQNMTDLSNLKRFPSLTDLRIQGIPLLNDLTAHERRQLLIALLPNVKKLNGGAPISSTEREDSERAFIRKYSDLEEKPLRYFELIAIHGELEPLVEVQLKPTTRVKLRVCFGDSIVEKHLKVYQTTTELKVHFEPLLGVQSSRMRLFYVDSEMREVVGREEMRYPQKQLYSYNMQDGDEIHVELKNSLHNIT